MYLSKKEKKEKKQFLAFTQPVHTVSKKKSAKVLSPERIFLRDCISLTVLGGERIQEDHLSGGQREQVATAVGE